MIDKKEAACTAAHQNYIEFNRRGHEEDTTQVAEKSSYLSPGTALTAFLKRYRRDLLQLECSCKVSRLVDCCDCILDEVTP